MRHLVTLATTFAFLVGGLVLPSTAFAADCKGESKSRCGERAECSWVEPYTRKDGVNVKGHCRVRRGAGDTISERQRKEQRRARERREQGRERREDARERKRERRDEGRERREKARERAGEKKRKAKQKAAGKREEARKKVTGDKKTSAGNKESSAGTKRER